MVRLFIAGLIWTLLAGDPLLQAFPTVSSWNGKPRRWNIRQRHSKLYYRIKLLEPSVVDLRTLGAIDLVHQAFAEWSEVEESQLRLLPAPPRRVEDILVVLTEQADPSGDSSGFAEFDKLSSEGELNHCRLKIFSYLSLSAESFKKVSLHETGHCLGLGHSLVPQAVMSYSFDTNHGSLDLDDRAALVRLYGRQKGPETPPSCGMAGVFLAREASRSNFWYGLLFPLVLSLFLSRSHRFLRVFLKCE